MKERRKTKEIKVGSVKVGKDNKISVQSMIKADPGDFERIKNQIKDLKAAGCEIVRLAVADSESVKTISRLKELAALDMNYDMPLVADIHFNYRLALESAHAGIDKIRINPGNIGSEDKIKAVADVCRAKKIPIRIGVNGGSLEKHILEKYGSPTAEALAQSAAYNIKLLEKFDFTDIIAAIKSSDVNKMIEANLIFAGLCEYPLHIGVTEAGPAHMGLIKNAAGIGTLLQNGIGDTIRVTLSADPVQEVYEGISILKSLGLYGKSIDIISCPTCGRCRSEVIRMADELEARLMPVEKNLKEGIKIKIAVMGCAVNGPGEAKEADFGIAGSGDGFLFFKKDEPQRKIPAEKAVDILVDEVQRLVQAK